MPDEHNGTVPKSAPQPIPKQQGFLNWMCQLGSPKPSSFIVSDADGDGGTLRRDQTMVARLRKQRCDSSSLSHDEALNLSRAGMSPPTTKDTPLMPVQSQQAMAAEARSRNRDIPRRPRRGSSKYDKLGLVAAYSGGPSSF